MVTLIQHLPNFFSKFTPEIFTFETIEELEGKTFIRQVSGFEHFKAFKIVPDYSEVPGRQHLLVATFTNGEYYVIGYLDKKIDYPTFNKNEY